MDERSKQDYPNPRRPVQNEMRWSHPDTKQRSAMFKSDILSTRQLLQFHFPHHFWRVPRLFLTSLTGIAYACKASSRRNPMLSNFNESDKGKTRRLFLFRESEKNAEKETPGGCFFVQLCLSGPKKV